LEKIELMREDLSKDEDSIGVGWCSLSSETGKILREAVDRRTIIFKQLEVIDTDLVHSSARGVAELKGVLYTQRAVHRLI
jgi:hypothetical protein